MARLEHFGMPDIRRYTAGKADWAASALPVEGEQAAHLILRIVRTGVPRCGPTDLVGDVRDQARRTGWQPCLRLDAAAERFGAGVDSLLVTTADGILLGLLARADVERQPGTAAAATRSG